MKLGTHIKHQEKDLRKGQVGKMKYGMPRKCDDEKRLNLFLILAGVIVFATVAGTGYKVYMKPYEVRRAELKELVWEADGLIARIDESLVASDSRVLLRAQNTLEGLAAHADRGGVAVSDLVLDVELYIGGDQERARQLLREHAKVVEEHAQGCKVLRETAEQAATEADVIGQLLGSDIDEEVLRARDELKTYRDELDTLVEKSRPEAEESEFAKSHLIQTQTNVMVLASLLSGQADVARQSIAATENLVSRANAAERLIQESIARASTLRKEASTLRIDQDSGRFSEWRSRLRTVAEDAKDAKETCIASEKTVGEDRGRIQAKAKRDCNEIVKAIKQLVEEHGSLLPANQIDKANAAVKELNDRLIQSNEEWKKQTERIGELVIRADNLRGDAMKLDGQLDSALITGVLPVEANRIATVMGELAQVRSALQMATEKLDAGGLKSEIEKIVGRAQASLSTLQAEVPDVQQIVREIHSSAKTASKNLTQAHQVRTEIVESLSAGHGSEKDVLERALKACTFPEDAARDLAELASLTAANGKECMKLQARLKSAKAQAEAFEEKVEKIHQLLANALESRKFVPNSWEAGAIGRVPGGGAATYVSTGSVLVVEGTVSARQYEWEFDFVFDNPSSHTVEVLVSKPLANPVNPSIDRNQSVVQERQRLKGGFINVIGQLTFDGRTARDNMWIHNYPKLDSPQKVVEASGWLGEGHQTFKFRIDLDSNPKDTRSDIAWHPSLLQFTILLDGQQVRKFLHLVP